MVRCLSQSHQCITRQEYHLGDVSFENRKHTLNKILQLIIHNSSVCYTEADSPKELNENRYILLSHPLCIYSIIQFKRETLGIIER
jgi:hypothetical protein